MSVKISGVAEGSPAKKVGINPGDTLLQLNGNDIMDVLDYRFYQNDINIKIKYENSKGHQKTKTVRKSEYDELGMEFETYLMDKQRSCKNKCIFCFIDQLPKGMRDTLYFKDDDSRMSFLFGNYITLTNISEHEIERIIKLHISPINISVHTTNPELRCKMMKNRFAGKSLDVLWRLCDSGININCQLVLCPGWNDGDELKRTLQDLIERESIKSISSVPVGLTKYRDKLEKLYPFTKETAGNVIDIIEQFGDKTVEMYGERRVFAGDEFYITAERDFPDTDHYGDFVQLENGVGMWTLFKADSLDALDNTDRPLNPRKITSVTGEAAYPLISEIVDKCSHKWHNLECRVVAVKNNFFGGKITVTGLVTGGDIIDQLHGIEIGTELLIPVTMLRNERDMFLDSITVEEVEKALNVKCRLVENDGWDFISALAGK